MELRTTWAFVHIHLAFGSIHEILLVSDISDCFVHPLHHLHTRNWDFKVHPKVTV